MPLPSFTLLDMRLKLNQIVSLPAAAEERDDDHTQAATVRMRILICNPEQQEITFPDVSLSHLFLFTFFLCFYLLPCVVNG